MLSCARITAFRFQPLYSQAPSTRRVASGSIIWFSCRSCQSCLSCRAWCLRCVHTWTSLSALCLVPPRGASERCQHGCQCRLRKGCRYGCPCRCPRAGRLVRQGAARGHDEPGVVGARCARPLRRDDRVHHHLGGVARAWVVRRKSKAAKSASRLQRSFEAPRQLQCSTAAPLLGQPRGGGAPLGRARTKGMPRGMQALRRMAS